VTNYADGMLNVIQDAPELPPTLTPTATPTLEEIAMSGLVYDTSVGQTKGIPFAHIQIDAVPCKGYYSATTADAAGHYTLFVTKDYLHQCGQINVHVWASGYQPYDGVILENDLLQNLTQQNFALTLLPTNTPTSTPTVTNTPPPTLTPTITPTATNTPLVSPTPTSTNPPVFGPYVLTTVPVGIHPKSAAIENLRDRGVFTALFDSSRLQILDESNYQLYGSVDTGGLHPNQVVRGAPFTFDISNRDSNSLTVLDWRVPGPACTAPTGNLPWGVAYNPTNHRIYVANYGLPKESGSISVFDEQCNRVTTIPLPNDRPALMTEMNGYVYAAGWGTGNLYIIDGNNVVTNPINVGPGAFGIAANPVTGRIYLTNRLTGRFYIIIAGSGNANISMAVTLPSPGYAVAANPNLSHTFVVSAVSDQVFALDGYYGGLIWPLPVGHQDADEGGQGIVVNIHSNRLYVSNYADGTVTVIQDIVTYPQPPPPCLPNCGVPILASLPNGAKTRQHAVALDWTDTPSVTRYEIVVKQGSTTGTTVASSKSLTLSKFTTRPLTPGKTYYWRVRACTAKGCNAWTKWWRFVVSN
jgi:DNA-binding beta-propeller fold protein YncE